MSRNNSGITRPTVQESQTDVIQDVMNAVKNLKSDYESLKKEHSRLLAENRELEEKIEMLKSDNERLENSLRAEKNSNEVLLNSKNMEIAKLNAKVAELEKQVKTQSENTESLLCELDKGKKQFASELLEVLGEFSNSDNKKKAETEKQVKNQSEKAEMPIEDEPVEDELAVFYNDGYDVCKKKPYGGGWWKVK